jgi:hypothetical protein
MSKRTSQLRLILIVVLVLAAAAWFGGGWLWQKLLEMHGRH